VRSRVGQEGWRARGLAIAILLLAAGAARAAPLMAIAPIDGDPAPALTRQLQWRLCDAFDCEPWHRVATAGELDLDKARERGVAGILIGAVAERRGRRTLSLSILKRSRSPAAHWRFYLDAQGALGPAALELLVKDLEAQFGGAAHASAAPALPPPPPPPRPAEALGIDLRRSERAAPVAPLPPPPAVAPKAAPPEAPGDARPTAARGPWLAVELGAFATRRELRFEGLALGAAQLREVSAPAISGPDLRLEAYPAAPFTEGLAAGLGIFGSYARSVGLRTSAVASGTGGGERASEYARLAVGATWRSPPLTAARLVVAPSVSYESLQATVEPPVPGLADARLSGLKAALWVEVLAGSRVSLLAGGGYARWTTAKDLIAGSPAYFPGGDAAALEAEAGVSVAVVRRISLRALGTYSRTRYGFAADPSGVYRATGASDAYLGARVALRAVY
jgi:hypothetical protein